MAAIPAVAGAPADDEADDGVGAEVEDEAGDEGAAGHGAEEVRG